MKGVYWRSQKTPTWALVLVGLVAGTGLLSAEHCPSPRRPSNIDEKLSAARLAKRSFEQIGLARLRTDTPIDPRLDPTASGLIGIEQSDVTSNYGHLPAKRTSVNPNFAAVVVGWLQELGVRKGDTVALGVSGSFPALNIAVYAAIETLGIKPLIVASASASAYGANLGDLTWLDMERELYAADLVSFRSLAATIGGDQDRGMRRPPVVRETVIEAITRNNIVFLDPQSLGQSVKLRLDVIDAACGSCDLKAYINVGGGEASLGSKPDRERIGAGITQRASAGLTSQSVARALLERGIPLIHLGRVQELALQYAFPVEPLGEVAVGEGLLYLETSHQRWIAGLAIICILLTLYAVTRLDVVQRIVASSRAASEKDEKPGQMV